MLNVVEGSELNMNLRVLNLSEHTNSQSTIKTGKLENSDCQKGIPDSRKRKTRWNPSDSRLRCTQTP